jgi:hypothetical protein
MCEHAVHASTLHPSCPQRKARDHRLAQILLEHVPMVDAVHPDDLHPNTGNAVARA